MRQSGIIAAAGIYALQHNVERLSQDHENAKRLANKISQIPGVDVDLNNIETNLIFFNIKKTGKTSAQISTKLKEKNIYIGATSSTKMRAVTHIDISKSTLLVWSGAWPAPPHLHLDGGAGLPDRDASSCRPPLLPPPHT